MKNLKNKFILASAILALASCADNSYLGDQEANKAGGPISFGFDVPSATRGTAEDANKLNNQFIVWGEKNETQTGAGSAPTEGNLVFQNYKVAYTASTAYTTTSNTNDWEYVGIAATSEENTNITPNSGTDAQTIKYWDNAATSYTFTAVSAKPEDISNGRIKITKNETGTDVYGKGYTVTLAKDNSNNYPTLTDLYFADRINIAKGSGFTHNVVQFTFRNVLSQVRVGMYETIPGYEVSEIKFYQTNGSTEYTKSTTSAFGAVCPNVSATNFVGTVTATYYDATKTEIQNHPKITITPGSGLSNDHLVLGTNFSTLTTSGTPKYLGTVATAPTYDTDGGAFTSVLPQVNNTAPLQLKVNYTLYNTVTKETIQITGKTAEIPGKYLQWMANYKYTYLFKITDDDLNPITFDAVVVEAENGNAEYITTVTEPSITTFGVVVDNDDKFKNFVTEKNEYQIPGGEDKLDIYATFMQGVNVLTPQLTSSDKANYVTVYFVDYKTGATDAEKAEKPITELSVANAIEHTSGLITATAIQSENNIYFANDAGDVPQPVTSVPAEDGVGTKSIEAVKLPGVKTAGKYAVEIVTYEGVTGLTAGTSDVSAYYTLDTSNSTYNAATGIAVDGTTYYKQVKTYKVITVQAAQ